MATTANTASPAKVPAFLSGWDGADGWREDPSLDSSDDDLDDDAWGAWPVADTTTENTATNLTTNEPPVPETSNTPTEHPAEVSGFKDMPFTEESQQSMQDLWGVRDVVEDAPSEPPSIEPPQTVTDAHKQHTMPDNFAMNPVELDELPVPVVTRKVLEPVEEDANNLNVDRLREDAGLLGEVGVVPSSNWATSDLQPADGSQHQTGPGIAFPPSGEMKGDMTQLESGGDVDAKVDTKASSAAEDSFFADVPENESTAKDTWGGWDDLPLQESENTADMGSAANAFSAFAPVVETSTPVSQQERVKFDEDSHAAQSFKSTVDDSTFVAGSGQSVDYSAIESSFAVGANNATDAVDAWGEWDVDAGEEKDNPVPETNEAFQVFHNLLPTMSEAPTHKVGVGSTSETSALTSKSDTVEKSTNDPFLDMATRDEISFPSGSEPLQNSKQQRSVQEGGASSRDSVTPQIANTSKLYSQEHVSKIPQVRASIVDQPCQSGGTFLQNDSSFASKNVVESPHLGEGLRTQDFKTSGGDYTEWSDAETQLTGLREPTVHFVDESSSAPRLSVKTDLENSENSNFLHSSSGSDRNADPEDSLSRVIEQNEYISGESAAPHEQEQESHNESNRAAFTGQLDSTKHGLAMGKQDEEQARIWRDDVVATDQTSSMRAFGDVGGEGLQQSTSCVKVEFGEGDTKDGILTEVDPIAKRIEESFGEGWGDVPEQSEATSWDWDEESHRLDTSLRAERDVEDRFGYDGNQGYNARTQIVQGQRAMSTEGGQSSLEMEHIGTETVVLASDGDVLQEQPVTESEVVNDKYVQWRSQDEGSLGADIRSTDVDASSTVAGTDIPSIAAPSSFDDGEWDSDQGQASWEPFSDSQSSREQTIKRSNVDQNERYDVVHVETQSQNPDTQVSDLLASTFPAVPVSRSMKAETAANLNFPNSDYPDETSFVSYSGPQRMHVEDRNVSIPYAPTNTGRDAVVYGALHDNPGIAYAPLNHQSPNTTTAIASKRQNDDLEQSRISIPAQDKSSKIPQQGSPRLEPEGEEDVELSASHEEFSNDMSLKENGTPQLKGYEKVSTANDTEAVEGDLRGKEFSQSSLHVHGYDKEKVDSDISKEFRRPLEEDPVQIMPSGPERNCSTEEKSLRLDFFAPPQKGSGILEEGQNNPNGQKGDAVDYWTDEFQSISNTDAQNERGRYLDEVDASKYAPKSIHSELPHPDQLRTSDEVTVGKYWLGDVNGQDGPDLGNKKSLIHPSAASSSHYHMDLPTGANQQQPNSFSEQEFAHKSVLGDAQAVTNSHLSWGEFSGNISNAQDSAVVQNDRLHHNDDQPFTLHSAVDEVHSQQPNEGGSRVFSGDLSQYAPQNIEMKYATIPSQGKGYTSYAPDMSSQGGLNDFGSHNVHEYRGTMVRDKRYESNSPQSLAKSSEPSREMNEDGSTLEEEETRVEEFSHQKDNGLLGYSAPPLMEGSLRISEDGLQPVTGELKNEENTEFSVSSVGAESNAFSEQLSSGIAILSSQGLPVAAKDSTMYHALNRDSNQKPWVSSNEDSTVQENSQITVKDVYSEPSFESYAPRSQNNGHTDQVSATQYTRSSGAISAKQGEISDVYGSQLVQHAFEPGGGPVDNTLTDYMQQGFQEAAVSFPASMVLHNVPMPVNANTISARRDVGYSPQSRMSNIKSTVPTESTDMRKLSTVNASNPVYNPEPPEISLDSNIYSYPYSIMDTLPTGETEYRPPRPVMSWGFGGTFVTFFPGSVVQDQFQLDKLHTKPSRNLYSVCVHDARAIIGDTADEDLVCSTEAVSPLSMPIRPSDLQILSAMCERIANRLGVVRSKQTESGAVLWRLLGLLCRKYNSDWRKEAISAVTGPSSVPMYGRDKSSSLVSTSMKKFPLKEHLSSRKSDLERMDTAAEVERVLAEGDGRRAVQIAQEGGLWSLALVLACTLDKNLYKAVLSEFAEVELNDGSAVQTLCFSMAENNTEIIRKATSESGLKEWRKTVGILITARNSHLQTTDNNGVRFLRLIEQLGDALVSQLDDIVAAQVCYLISGSVSALDVSRVTLLGADMKVPAGRPRSCGSPASILQSFVFEAVVAAQSGESFPHILPFRLILCEALCAAGRPGIALEHCESIGNIIRALFDSNGNLAARLFTPPFLSRLEALEQRLQSHLGLKKVEKKSKLTALGRSFSSVFSSTANGADSRTTKRLEAMTVPRSISTTSPDITQRPSWSAQPSHSVDYSQSASFPHQASQPLPTNYAPNADNASTRMLNPVLADTSTFNNEAQHATTSYPMQTVPPWSQNTTRVSDTVQEQSREQKASGNERWNLFVSKTIGMLAPADGDLSPPPRARSNSGFPMNVGPAPSIGLEHGTGTRAPGNDLSGSHVRSASMGDVPMNALGYSNVSNGTQLYGNYSGTFPSSSVEDLSAGAASGEMGVQYNLHGSAVQETTSVTSSGDASRRRSTSDMTATSQISEKKPPKLPKRLPAASTSAIETSEKRSAPKGWSSRFRERIMSAFRGPPRAHMGYENKFVFDKERGTWVMDGEEPDEEDDVPPPPPDDTMFGGNDPQVPSSSSFDNLRHGALGLSAGLPRSYSMQDSKSTGDLDSMRMTRAATHNPSHRPPPYTSANQMMSENAARNINGRDASSDVSTTSLEDVPTPYINNDSHVSSPALPVATPNRYRAHTNRRSGRRAYVDTFNKDSVAGPSVSTASIGRPLVPGVGGLGPRPGRYNVFTPSSAQSSGADFSGNSTRQGSHSFDMPLSQGGVHPTVTSAEVHEPDPVRSGSSTSHQYYSKPYGSPQMGA